MRIRTHHLALSQDRASWRRRRPAALLLAALLLAGAAACSDGDDGSSSSGNGGTGGTGSDGGGSEVVEQAEEAIADYLEVPESIGITEALSEAPPEDIKLATVACDAPGCTVFLEAAAEASEVLGWSHQSFVTTGAPEDIVAQFDLAFDTDPDAIMTSGLDRATLGTALEKAEELGIPVVNSAVPDEVAPPYVAIPVGLPVFERNGELLGNYLVAHSGGDANVLIFNTSLFPILDAAAQKVASTIEDTCPDCTVSFSEFAIEDVGNTLPGRVVSELQQNPDVEYVVFTDGGFATGVPAALQGASLTDVQIAGVIIQQANLENIRNGSELAWTGYSSIMQAWYGVDAFARHFAGDEQISDDLYAATQIVTVDTAPDGDEWLVPNYQDQFAELWQVG